MVVKKNVGCFQLLQVADRIVRSEIISEFVVTPSTRAALGRSCRSMRSYISELCVVVEGRAG